MSKLALVGDIGGTNARFSLVEQGSVSLQHTLTLPCADYENIDAACHAYFEKVGVQGVTEACLAFACPVEGQTINMTNNHWCFDRDTLKTTLGLTSLKLVNDFTAMALGMLHIEDDEKVQVGGDSAMAKSPIVVLGPGTGLGVSALVPVDGGWMPLSTEGGHISYAPVDDVDIKVWQILNRQFGRVSVERVLCGQGLLNLYLALCEINDVLPSCQSPADVSGAALNGSDPIAVETLSRFSRMLGTVAGDLVLAMGARGGVYLCGGVLPRVKDFFINSSFREGFEAKGRFVDYLTPVPAWLCLADNPGLLGSAAALSNPRISG